MRKLFYLLAFFCTSFYYAQTNGITYQAVIYLPNGQNIPGQDIQNSPMTNRLVCLQFSLIDDLSQLEYQETIQTTTDEFGMVNLLIGTGTQTGGYASSFNAVLWNNTRKSLKVELDALGNCQEYIVLSDDPLSAVPFAYAAITANNVSGTVAVFNGGTGANNPTDARINLGLGNVDNTSDATKPISADTQAALDTKEALTNKSTTPTLGTSDVLYPTQNAVKTYVDAQVASATIADADAVTKGKIQLAGDLGGTAAAPTVPALATKENTANKSAVTTLGTSDVLFPTQNAVKTYVDTNITSVNNANSALQATVTANANAATTAIAAVQADVDANEATGTAADTALQNNITTLQNTVATNATNTAAALALKEDAANKSTATTLGTSNVLFPTQNAVKTYVDAQVASATIADADAVTKGKIQLAGDLSGTAAAPTVPALATKENTANKSAVTTLGTSDVLFPTQNAVKTYVDTNITSVNSNITTLQGTVTANANAATTAIAAVQADVDANETATNNALATKENAANKSTTTTLGNSDQLFPTQNAVKTYVDTNITSVNSNITTLQGTVTANANAATTAIAAVQADVDANETAANNALATKENAANKSTTTTLGTSDDLFPTQNAVKTYVDTNFTSVNSDITTLQATVTANANAATTAITVVQADVDANETAANTALALKEDVANKSTNIVTDANSTTKYPSVKLIKDYVDTLNAAAGVADNTITSAKITDGTIMNIDVNANAAIDYSKLNLNNSIVTLDITDNAVTSSKISDANVTNIKLATGIDATKLADGSVTNLELQYIGTLSSDVQIQINGINSDIATNTTNIATNTAAIATNTTDIATNTTNIAANTSAIATNTTNIATNTTDIAANTAAITTNTTDIATNTTNIDTNTAAIATNTTNIAANTSAIATNTTNIATNTTDIATNTAAIATNTTDIATNTTDIATNTAAIATNT
ncbi:beta strand repeat-containing protein, partial [Flavobacterium sp.]|uniref:beta strand repeat-containing protein n=1 Tax=Flavobacterium sp. TaxID=239 RepID=UPI0037BF729D